MCFQGSCSLVSVHETLVKLHFCGIFTRFLTADEIYLEDNQRIQPELFLSVRCKFYFSASKLALLKSKNSGSLAKLCQRCDPTISIVAHLCDFFSCKIYPSVKVKSPSNTSLSCCLDYLPFYENVLISPSSNIQFLFTVCTIKNQTYYSTFYFWLQQKFWGPFFHLLY